MGRKKHSFVILGLGSFGSVVASTLAQYDNHVLGIDISERRVAQLAHSLSNVAILDATDEYALREAGVQNYETALVSLGGNLEAGILSVMNLKMIGVGNIWVKADSRTHHRIMSKMGVDRVLLPDVEMGQHTAQMMNNPAVQDYVALGNGYNVVNMRVPERLNEHPLAHLRLDVSLRSLGLMRGTEFIPTTTETIMKTGDRLLILGRKPELLAFGESF